MVKGCYLEGSLIRRVATSEGLYFEANTKYEIVRNRYFEGSLVDFRVQFPFNFDTKDLTFIDLCFVVKQLASLSKVERKLAMKFEQAQISRKLAQTTTSHRKLVVKRGTSMHKVKICNELDSRLIVKT